MFLSFARHFFFDIFHNIPAKEDKLLSLSLMYDEKSRLWKQDKKFFIHKPYQELKSKGLKDLQRGYRKK